MDSTLITPLQDAATIRRLRRGIGLLGMALPFVLTIGHAVVEHRFTLLGSISGYYYTGMRDVFVGGLCAIGVFLISYRYQKLDDVLSTLAGVLAITVAVFPTLADRRDGVITTNERVIGLVHMYSAAALFVVLAWFCLFVFTRSDPTKPAITQKKRLRNRIFYACGAIILACVALAVASHRLPASAHDTFKPLFWCQTIAVLAFGAAWLVKGETLFRDSRAAADEGDPGPISTPAVPTNPTASVAGP